MSKSKFSCFKRFQIPNGCPSGPGDAPTPLFSSQGHSHNPVTSLAVDPEGLLLASGCSKSTGTRGSSAAVNIWSLSNGLLVHTATGTGGVNRNSLKWLPGTSRLAMAFSRSTTVRVLRYGREELALNLPLAVARCTLMKKGVRGRKCAPKSKSKT